MRDLLHSEIDQYEAMREEASQIVDAVKEALKEQKTIEVDFETLLSKIAELVGEHLDPLSTKAARAGMEMARQRAAKARAAS